MRLQKKRIKVTLLSLLYVLLCSFTVESMSLITSEYKSFTIFLQYGLGIVLAVVLGSAMTAVVLFLLLGLLLQRTKLSIPFHEKVTVVCISIAVLLLGGNVIGLYISLLTWIGYLVLKNNFYIRIKMFLFAIALIIFMEGIYWAARTSVTDFCWTSSDIPIVTSSSGFSVMCKKNALVSSEIYEIIIGTVTPLRNPLYTMILLIVIITALHPKRL